MSTDIVKRFGSHVRRLRLERKLSQVALSEKIGIEQQHLSNLELGKKEAGLRVIEMIAIGLRIPLSELFSQL
jgi:transcriptional regulator with XRE-family HTH domain